MLCQHLSLPGSAAFLWHTAALSPYSVFNFSAPATDLGKGFCASRLSAFPVQWEISHAQTILGVNTSSSSSSCEEPGDKSMGQPGADHPCCVPPGSAVLDQFFDI